MKKLILFLSLLLVSSPTFQVFAATGILGQRSSNVIVPISSGLPVITAWESFTPTISGITKGTGATETAFKRRVGENIEIQYKLVLGTSGSMSGTIELTIPDSLTADTNSIPTLSVVGNAGGYDLTEGRNNGHVILISTSVLRISSENDVNANWDATHPFTWAATDILTFNASIPITQWADTGVTGEADVSAYIPDASSTSVGLVKKATAEGSNTSGTGGYLVQTSNTTAYTASETTIISATLDKGTYLLSYDCRGYITGDSTDRNIKIYLKIGGTTVKGTLYDTAKLNVRTNHSIPMTTIVIDTDSTVVAITGYIASMTGTWTSPLNILSIIRVGEG